MLVGMVAAMALSGQSLTDQLLNEASDNAIKAVETMAACDATVGRGQFSSFREWLRQTPYRANTIPHLEILYDKSKAKWDQEMSAAERSRLFPASYSTEIIRTARANAIRSIAGAEADAEFRARRGY